MSLWLFDDQNNPVRPAREVEKLPNGDTVSPPVAGYVHRRTGYYFKDHTPVPPDPPPAPTPEEQAQQEHAQLTEDLDMFIAIGVATVRLVKFAADNPAVIQNATEGQIVQRYKDEVLSVLRARKGL